MVEGIISLTGVTPAPAFCFRCGSALPWTQARTKAAKELADEATELSEPDRAIVKQALDEVGQGGPEAEVAAVRLRRLLSKAGTKAGQALWKMTVDVATEAAKKILLGT